MHKLYIYIELKNYPHTFGCNFLCDLHRWTTKCSQSLYQKLEMRGALEVDVKQLDPAVAVHHHTWSIYWEHPSILEALQKEPPGCAGCSGVSCWAAAASEKRYLSHSWSLSNKAIIYALLIIYEKKKKRLKEKNWSQLYAKPAVTSYLCTDGNRTCRLELLFLNSNMWAENFTSLPLPLPLPLPLSSFSIFGVFCFISHLLFTNTFTCTLLLLQGSRSYQDREEGRSPHHWEVLHSPDCGLPHQQACCRGDCHHPQQASSQQDCRVWSSPLMTEKEMQTIFLFFALSPLPLWDVTCAMCIRCHLYLHFFVCKTAQRVESEGDGPKWRRRVL